jgi:EAL domain-containing protein (putative c-di-GMP-specific phosphodiesterase class I)
LARVDGVEASAQKNAVARTIVNLSDTLQLATVAEGIENIKQTEILRELGCEFGQGFCFARPLTIEKFERMLENTIKGLQSVSLLADNLPESVSKSIN